MAPPPWGEVIPPARMVAVLPTSSGTGCLLTPILAASEKVGVPAKALPASPEEAR